MKFLLLMGLLSVSGSALASNTCQVALENHRGVFAYYVTYAPQDPGCMQAVRNCRHAKVMNNLDRFECVVRSRGEVTPAPSQGPRPYYDNYPVPQRPAPQPYPQPRPQAPRPYEPRRPAPTPAPYYPAPRVEERRPQPTPYQPAPRVEERRPAPTPVPTPVPRVEERRPAPTPVPTPVPNPEPRVEVPTSTNTAGNEAQRAIEEGETVIFNNKPHIVVNIPSAGFLDLKPEGGNRRSIQTEVSRSYVAITRGCQFGICAKESVINLKTASYAAIAGISFDGTYILKNVGNTEYVLNVKSDEFALTKGCTTTTNKVCVGNVVQDRNNVYWTVVALEWTNDLVLESTDDSKKIVLKVKPDSLLVTR